MQLPRCRHPLRSATLHRPSQRKSHTGGALLFPRGSSVANPHSKLLTLNLGSRDNRVARAKPSNDATRVAVLGHLSMERGRHGICKKGKGMRPSEAEKMVHVEFEHSGYNCHEVGPVPWVELKAGCLRVGPDNYA